MIDWKLTKLETGYDKSYFDKYPKSRNLVYAICNGCDKGRWVKMAAYHSLCGSCSRKGKIVSEKTKLKLSESLKGHFTSEETKEKIRKSLMGHSVSDESKEKNRLAHLGKSTLPKPKFVKEKDKFIPGTQIDRILTIKKFGYDPINLGLKSNKRIWVICKRCNNGRSIIRYKYRDLCKICSRLPPKPKFVPESERFLNNTQIDRILTIGKYGYDPADLSKKSNRKVITICKICKKERIIIKAGYNDSCNSCWSDKSRMKASCTRQNIKLEDFNGFIGKHPERDYVLSKELCIKLNTYFKGSEFHHIISKVGIYLPRDLHQSIKHNMKTGKNINEINKLAWNYLIGGI